MYIFIFNLILFIINLISKKINYMNDSYSSIEDSSYYSEEPKHKKNRKPNLKLNLSLKKKKINKKKIKFARKNSYNNNNNQDESNSIPNKHGLKIEPFNQNLKYYPNETKKTELIYSPRTTFNNKLENEDKLYLDLQNSFDPITIKILKSYFKERLGKLNKTDFINILKNHLIEFHPGIENREEILIKLLSRLFNEINLYDSEYLEWNKFTNFLIYYSNANNSQVGVDYSLRFYKSSKNSIDDSNFTEIISYAFYIEKYNLIGLVQDGKSIILFYDGSSCKLLKNFIDITETQKNIDKLEILELDFKTQENLLKESVDKKLKQLIKNKNDSLNNNLNEEIKPTRKETKNLINQFKYETSLLFEKQLKENEEKLRLKYKNLHQKNSIDFNYKIINKKLTILTTIFIPEYDTLLVSSSNNKISAWKYNPLDQVFKNVNTIVDNKIDKENFNLAILTPSAPQHTMTWDPIQKFLYSGQMDGKILKWNILKSKNLESETLDYNYAKSKRELILKKKRHNIRDIKKYATIKMEENAKNEKRKETINGMKEKITSNRGGKTNENEMKINNEKLLNDIKSESLKRDSVSSLVILGKLQLLAAGYYNGTIILWDPMLKDYRKYYIDQNTGIYQLIFNDKTNLLFSCGFDHSIFIYDPYIDSSAIYKLEGHNWSINSIALNLDELISIDILGTIKIWDLNTFKCFQTINLIENFLDKKSNNLQKQDEKFFENNRKKKISSNLKMIYLNKVKKIMTYGDKLMLFEGDLNKNPNLTDDNLIIGCFYMHSKLSLICVCIKKLKIWNILNGKVKKNFVVFNEESNTEIICFTNDKKYKKIFLGDNTGKISCINLFTGITIKKFYTKEEKDIINLNFSNKNNYLIAQNSNKMFIFNDNDLTTNELLKEIELQIMNIKTIYIDDLINSLVLGLNNGKVKFMELEHYKTDGDDETNKNNKISHYYNNDIINIMSLFNDLDNKKVLFDIILISYNNGKNEFIITPPSSMKFKCLYEFVLEEKKDSIIISSSIDTLNKLLFCGDQYGYIYCFQLDDFFELKNNEKNLNNNLEINLNLKYKIQGHREKIKYMNFSNEIFPNILVTTSNDRKIKLFKSNSGEYIDELRQIANKYSEIPIGIEYYITDPLVSKIPENLYEEYNNNKRRILRDKNFNFQKLKNEIIKYRTEGGNINKYYELISELNAREKLYFLTKFSSLPENMSNNWKFNININKIEQQINKKETSKKIRLYRASLKQRLSFEDINDMLKNGEKKLKNEIEFNSKKIAEIFDENYIPEFLNNFDENQINKFTTILNDRIRNVKLAQSKINLNKKNLNMFLKEDKRKQTINLKLALEKLNQNDKKKKKKKVYDKYEEKRKEIYGTKHVKIKSSNDLFKSYQSDVNKGLNDLQFNIEEKIHKKLIDTVRLFSEENKKKSRNIVHLPLINSYQSQ